MVSVDSTMTTGSHQSASGPSASTNSRRMSAKAPTLGPTDR